MSLNTCREYVKAQVSDTGGVEVITANKLLNLRKGGGLVRGETQLKIGGQSQQPAKHNMSYDGLAREFVLLLLPLPIGVRIMYSRITKQKRQERRSRPMQRTGC